MSVGLVGRRDEMAALAAAVQGLGRRLSGFVAVQGEPGIGKTRLLEELARRAEQEGHLVLTGRGTELERELPFAVWRDALDEYTGRLGPDRVARLLGDRADDLGGVLSATGAPPAALADERFRGHRAVATLLERIGDAHPLVLALDDLHWADGASLELLQHLLRRPPRGAVLVALAFRSGRLPAPVLAALEAARRTGQLVDLRLAPLAAGDVDALLGGGPEREELHRLSGGNPFYALELARVRGGVPATVAEALAEEFAALGSSAWSLARGAAVAGDPVALELAAAAAALPEPAAALDELVAAGLLLPTGVPREFRFRHPIVRSAIYEAAGEGWKLAAHARAAAALEARGAPLAARAHHVERCAGPGDEAAIALLSEAAREQAPRAPAGAIRWLQGALRLLPESDVERRLGLLVPLATAQFATGQLERALATLLDALGLVPAALIELRVRLVVGCAACENLLGRHWAAHERLARMLAELPEDESGAAASLRIELAADALYDTDFGAMAEHAEAARAIAGDPGRAAVAAALLCFAHYGQGDIESAEAARAEAAALLGALPDERLAERLDAPYYLGFGEYFCERYDDAIRHLRRGIAVSRAAGHGQFVAPMMVGLAHALEVRGRLAEALDTAEGAVEAGRLAGNRQLTSWALVAEGWIAAVTGDLRRAGAAAEETIALVAGLDDSVLTLAAQAHAAVIFLEAGEPARCLALASLAGAPDFPRVEPARRVWLQAYLAVAELALGDRDAAARYLDRTCVSGDSSLLRQLPRTDSALLHARALLALHDGDAAAAAELARRASQRASEVGAIVEASRARIVAGRAAALAGDSDGAVAALSRVEAELSACGAHRLRDEAARELRRLGRPAGARQRRGARGDGLAALSGREREIAELVALGGTNRQIAAQLFLSEKTVEGHLTHVFAKLGVSSRAAVAAAIAARPPHARVG